MEGARGRPGSIPASPILGAGHLTE
jgi:hypothetical protein